MIEKIVFDKKKETKKGSVRTKFGYIADVANVAGKTFNFKPGLNIIVGKNGSGKSTVLTACGTTLAAVQGGFSTVTESWMRDVFNLSSKHADLPWKLSHDGQAALFVDPRVTVGLNMGAFDEDFFSVGVGNVVAKGSTGEKTLHRINTAVGAIIGKEKIPTDIIWKVDKKSVNDVWQSRLSIVSELVKGNIKKGQQTILMDEPESYLGIPIQVGFWKRIMAEDAKRFDDFQVIIATHSPFAFGIPHANYIEMEAGYIKECEASLRFAKNL